MMKNYRKQDSCANCKYCLLESTYDDGDFYYCLFEIVIPSLDDVIEDDKKEVYEHMKNGTWDHKIGKLSGTELEKEYNEYLNHHCTLSFYHSMCIDDWKRKKLDRVNENGICDNYKKGRVKHCSDLFKKKK